MKNDIKIILIVLIPLLSLLSVTGLVSYIIERHGKLMYDTIFYAKEYGYAVRRQTYEHWSTYKSIFTLIDGGKPVDTLCFTSDRRCYWASMGDLYFTKDTVYVERFRTEHTPLTNSKIFYVIPHIDGESNEYYRYYPPDPDPSVIYDVLYWATEKLKNIQAEANNNGSHWEFTVACGESCERNRQDEFDQCHNIDVIPLKL